MRHPEGGEGVRLPTGDDGVDWRSYVEGTRGKYILHYATVARENTGNHPLLEEELANVISAAEQAWDQRAYETVLEMADRLWSGGGQFLDLRGHTTDGIRLLTRAVEAARSLGDKGQQGHLLGHLGRAWMALRNWESAEVCLQQALMIACEVGDRAGEASHLGNLGQLLLEQGKQQDAAHHFQKAIQLARELCDPKTEGRLLASLGLVKFLGPTREGLLEAIKHFRDAIELAKATRDRRGEASHFGSMGRAYELLGSHQLSLRPFVYGPDPADDASRYGQYSKELEQASQLCYYEAYQHYSEALRIAEEIRDLQMEERFRADTDRVLSDGKFSRHSSGDLNYNSWMRNRPQFDLDTVLER